jgi:hypothetical protein
MTIFLDLNLNNSLASYGVRHVASYRHLTPFFLRENHRAVHKGHVVSVFHILRDVVTLLD